MAEAEPVAEDVTKTNEVEDEVAGNAEADTGGTDEAEKPKSGTPDKALQRMQQDLGVAMRQIEALKEKAETGKGLSEADQAKLDRAKERLESIRGLAGDPLADQILELTEKQSETETLKQQLAQANARLAALETKKAWEDVDRKYAGLDTQAIWKKSVKDAEETLGDEATQKAVERVASRTFEKRCDAALKRMKEGAAPKLDANNKASSESKYKVGSAQTSAPQLTEEEAVLAEARSLVVET